MKLRLLSYIAALLAFLGVAKVVVEGIYASPPSASTSNAAFRYRKTFPMHVATGNPLWLESELFPLSADSLGPSGENRSFRCRPKECPGTATKGCAPRRDRYLRALSDELGRRMSEAWVFGPMRAGLVFAIDDAGAFHNVDFTDYDGEPRHEPLLRGMFEGWSPGTPPGGCAMLWQKFKVW